MAVAALLTVVQHPNERMPGESRPAKRRPRSDLTILAFDGTTIALVGSVPNPPEQILPLADSVSREFLLHHHVCPVEVADDGTLVVLTAPDAHLDVLNDLRFAYRRDVRAQSASSDVVERSIERLATTRDRSIELSRADSTTDDFAADVRDLANQPPVVRYVNLLVREAYDAGASDIHLEAARSGLVVRFRLDGVLAPAVEPPAEMHHAIVSRLKMLAELDIAERRRPQDGRIRVRLESGELDLRVSTVPTMHGESVVLRLLDRGGRPVSLEELGMPAAMLTVVQRLSQRSSGLLLVTGPTGSGKTTTLYAALQGRNRDAEKIVTVEDPIEYHLSGVTQVPVHRQGGVTFATVLRSLLRQDPDVLMIGEMRDAETAEIAIQAAMTGHFVFSTLHTTDAIGAVTRLVDLGMPAYLIAATVEAVLAQRLVRRICDTCRVPHDADPELCAAVAGRPVGRIRLTKGVGCPSCRGTGYRGRVGVFELLVFDDDMKDAVGRGAARSELRELAEHAGMRTLKAGAWDMVVSGQTTIEEVRRAVL